MFHSIWRGFLDGFSQINKWFLRSKQKFSVGFSSQKCTRTGHPLKIPSPTKLTRLGHFPPASQAGRLAGPVFYPISFLWPKIQSEQKHKNLRDSDMLLNTRESGHRQYTEHLYYLVCGWWLLTFSMLVTWWTQSTLKILLLQREWPLYFVGRDRDPGGGYGRTLKNMSWWIYGWKGRDGRCVSLNM